MWLSAKMFSAQKKTVIEKKGKSGVGRRQIKWPPRVGSSGRAAAQEEADLRREVAEVRLRQRDFEDGADDALEHLRGLHQLVGVQQHPGQEKAQYIWHYQEGGGLN